MLRRIFLCFMDAVVIKFFDLFEYEANKHYSTFSIMKYKQINIPVDKFLGNHRRILEQHSEQSDIRPSMGLRTERSLLSLSSTRIKK